MTLTSCFISLLFRSDKLRRICIFVELFNSGIPSTQRMTDSSCYNFTPALTKKCGTHRNIAPCSPTEQTEGPEVDFSC